MLTGSLTSLTATVPEYRYPPAARELDMYEETGERRPDERSGLEGLVKRQLKLRRGSSPVRSERQKRRDDKEKELAIRTSRLRAADSTERKIAGLSLKVGVLGSLDLELRDAVVDLTLSAERSKASQSKVVNSVEYAIS